MYPQYAVRGSIVFEKLYHLERLPRTSSGQFYFGNTTQNRFRAVSFWKYYPEPVQGSFILEILPRTSSGQFYFHILPGMFIMMKICAIPLGRGLGEGPNKDRRGGGGLLPRRSSGE